MMKFMKIQAWIEQEFMPGCGPDNQTVRRWIEKGQIPGKQIGNLYFVGVESKKSDALINKALRNVTTA